VGNGEITVMMNAAWDAKVNKISLAPWLLHRYRARYLDQGSWRIGVRTYHLRIESRKDG